MKGYQIDSVPLEDDGGLDSHGSHFEKTLFGNEIMTADTSRISVLSIFTLSVLKDSGLYSVDLGQAEEFHWGKGLGCDFFKHFCAGKFLFLIYFLDLEKNTEITNSND